MSWKTLMFTVVLISALMVAACGEKNEASFAKCRKDCMPICLRLEKGGKQASIGACEAACVLGCQQLYGMGLSPGRGDEELY